MAERLISVVLPVYNEDRNIERCLRSLFAALKDVPHEILVCYDFDEDTTLGAIQAMADRPPTVRLVRNRIGRGAANALRAGFIAARGDVVVTTMADLSDPPERIPELARVLRDEEATVVCGSRYMPGGSQSGGPFIKTLLSRCAGLSLHYVAGVPTHDATNNFKAYAKPFLETVKIESDHAFDIALELTVKAHLGGKTIREVPSSWTDRSAGESRFQVWKWLPKYLRWFWKAMTVPLIVWGLLFASVLAGSFAQTFSSEPGAQRAAVLLWGTMGAVFILLARRVRGRTAWPDVILPLILVHHGHGAAFHAGAGAFVADVLGSILLALVVIGLSCGFRRLGATLRKTFGSVRASHVGLAALVFLVVARRFHVPTVEPEVGLDASWRLAFPWFFEHGLQAGVDWIFTYGPLGFIEQGAFYDDLFWSRILWWEIIARAFLAGALVMVIPKLANPVERVLFALVLVFLPQHYDSFLYAAVAAITVLLIHRRRPTFPAAALAFALFALIGASKFTYFTLCAVSVCCIAVDFARRRSLGAAAAAVGLFAAEFFAVWMLAGQNPIHFFSWVRASLQIAAGYNETMTLPVPAQQLQYFAIVLACTLALAVIAVWRTRSWSRAASCLAVLFALFVAYKGGFVQQGGSVTCFGYAALAPFLILPVRRGEGTGGPGVAAEPDPPVARCLGTLLRAVALGAAVMSFPAPNPLPLSRVTGNIGQSALLLDMSLSDMGRLEELREERVAEQARAKDDNALPRVKARVGDATIDVLGSWQMYAILNDLNYTPRPVFQSYSAYTPWLLRENYEFFAGEDAPRYLLWGPDSLRDFYYPALDGLAQRVILRDYQPVLIDRGMLLMERVRTTPKSAPDPERDVLIDRDIAFDEDVELESLPGECHLLYLDIDFSLLGAAVKTLFKAPRIEMQVTPDVGVMQRQRVSPGLIRTGAIARPYLGTFGELTSWFAGQPTRKLKSLRLHVDADERKFFKDSIHIRVERADDLVPHVSALQANALRYSMFETPPDEVQTTLPSNRLMMGRTEVLIVHAPSTIRYEIGAGTHDLTGSFAILPAAYDKGTDGVIFRCIQRAQDGTQRVVFERFLDPAKVEKDRGEQELKVTVWSDQPSTILFETETGYKGDGKCDWAVWWGLKVARRP